MLQRNRAGIFLAAALILAPMVMNTPAQAGERDRYGREYRTRETYQRVVILRNGDYRLPNGRVINSRRVVRVRTPGYWRLPNGDIVLPTREVVSSRRLVRQNNGWVRLPNGVLIRI